MNILPHKSWHVRTRKNIERVRRDEAKAAEEEEERQKRVALAEQEARTQILRLKAKSRLAQSSDVGTSNSEIVSTELEKATHINFFSEIEKKEFVHQTKNLENEAEKKAEKEKWERKIGLLTYLGESSVESQSIPPWYLQNKKLRLEQEAECLKTKEEKRDKHDPLLEMHSYLHPKKSKKHKKHMKEKKRSKEKEKAKKTTSSSSSSLEQLRAERLQREKNERSRAQSLMDKLQGKATTSQPENPVNERERQYNSQFNPSLARKRLEKPHYY